MSGDIRDLNLPRPQPVSGADAFELCPFDVDSGPLQLLEARPSTPWSALVVVPVAIGLLVAVTAVEGTLAQSIGWDVILHDLGASVGKDSKTLTTPDFPLLRDTASLGIVLCLSLCLPQLTKQWRLIRSLWKNLVGRGIIVIDDKRRASALFRRCNARWRQVGRYNLAVVLLALALSLILVLGQRISGVFRTFGPFLNPKGGGPLSTG